MKYTCSMETVQQNGRFTLFSSKFLSIYSILYGSSSLKTGVKLPIKLWFSGRKEHRAKLVSEEGVQGHLRRLPIVLMEINVYQSRGCRGAEPSEFFLMELALKVSGRGEICYLIFDFYTFYKHLYLERISCTARNLFFKSIFGKQN